MLLMMTARILMLLARAMLPEDYERALYLSQAIVAESEAAPVMGDELSTAAALLAIAKHESGWREDVQYCRSRGDNGRSIGLYQLMRGKSWYGYTADEICSSDGLQARLALRVLKRYRDQCPSCGPAFAFRGYASGDGGRETKAGRELYGQWLYETWRLKQ